MNDDQAAIRARCRHPSGAFVEFPRAALERSVPERFNDQVRLHPGRLAVRTPAGEATYVELAERINGVAATVMAECAEREARVALLFEHGVTLTAAVLGVLTAGRIVVSLDPAFPGERLAYILRDSGACLLLTSRSHLSLARELAPEGCRVLDAEGIGSSDRSVDLPIAPDDVAALIYTSGSTGEPKGVVQNHRNLLHGVLSYTNTLGICPEDRIATATSPANVGVLWFGLRALLNGAAFFPLDVRRQGVASLGPWLSAQEVTVFGALTVIRELASTLRGDRDLPTVRVVTYGGDSVYPSDVQLYRKHFSDDCVLAAGLGCTEVGKVTQYFIDKQTHLAGDLVPIGYPAEDMEVLLLDERREAVEVGQVGTLGVKSRYLSPGYWRRRDLTEAVFLRDPEGTNERVYLPGDLARQQPDGALVHLGRADSLVKIRGHRVAIAEVEAALRRVANVKAAIVTARDDGLGDRRLVAYVVPAALPAPTVSALRRDLARTLAEPMVPSTFVTMDALPITSTGKLDRRSLPAPDGARPRLDQAHVAPRDALEGRLVRIWEEVMGLSPVGVRDDFFDLGGHSLLAARLVARVEAETGGQVPLAALFQGRTVEHLARVLRWQGGTPPLTPVVAIQPYGTGLPFFLGGSHPHYVELAREMGTTQPFYALDVYALQGLRLSEGRAPYRRVEDIAARFVTEIRAVRPAGPYHLGGGCEGGMVAFEVAQQLQRQGERVASLIILEAPAPRRWRQPTLRLVRQIRSMLRAGSRAGLRPRELGSLLRHEYVEYVIFRGMSRYVPRRYPGRLIVVRAAGRREDRGDPTLGWGELAAEIESHVVSGDHRTWLVEHTREVAELLRACQDKALLDDEPTSSRHLNTARPLW